MFAMKWFLIFNSLLLSVLALNQDSQVAGNGTKYCWSGSNNPSAFNYPPKRVSCNGVHLVCQRNYENYTNLYEMSCSTLDYCLSEYQTVGVNESVWTEIECCFHDYCNAYPGQMVYNGTIGSTSPINSINIALVASISALLLFIH